MVTAVTELPSNPAASANPQERFSDRVENYARHRPGYPREILKLLSGKHGLRSDAIVADIGSGTGVSRELFLANGNTVFAVEPHGAMRQAAQDRLGGNPRFKSICGSAEQTALADASVDWVAAFQAFHWFDWTVARREFARILRSSGHVVLVWNERKTDSSPFLVAYEQLLLQFATDYKKVNHANVSPAALASFFGGDYTLDRLDNEQVFDLEGVRGRLL